MTSCVAQPLARPWQSLSRAQTTSEVASGKLEYGAGAFFAFDTTLGHSRTARSTQPEKQEDARAREEHHRNEAQDHWERVANT